MPLKFPGQLMLPFTQHQSSTSQVQTDIFKQLQTTLTFAMSDAIDAIDYVTRIGNTPIVIVDFATAHPGCDFLPTFQLFSPKEYVEDSLE